MQFDETITLPFPAGYRLPGNLPPLLRRPRTVSVAGQLLPAEQQPGGSRGYSVAADATYVVVGAPLTDVTGVQDAGVAVVYSATTGALVAILTNPSPAAGDRFGYAVAVSGNRVVVGASYDDTGAFDAGSVYVYDLASATPAVPVTVNDATPAINGSFGASVAVSGNRMVVAASNPSTALVYDLSGTPPVLVTTLAGSLAPTSPSPATAS